MRIITRTTYRRRVINTGVAAFGPLAEPGAGLADGLGVASAVAVGFFGGAGEAAGLGTAAAAAVAAHGGAGLAPGAGGALGIGESLAAAIGAAGSIGVADAASDSIVVMPADGVAGAIGNAEAASEAIMAAAGFAFGQGAPAGFGAVAMPVNPKRILHAHDGLRVYHVAAELRDSLAVSQSREVE